MLCHTGKYHFRWKRSGPGQGLAPPQERDEIESMSHGNPLCDDETSGENAHPGPDSLENRLYLS